MRISLILARISDGKERYDDDIYFVVPRGGGERVPIPESRLEMKTPLPRGAGEGPGPVGCPAKKTEPVASVPCNRNKNDIEAGVIAFLFIRRGPTVA